MSWRLAIYLVFSGLIAGIIFGALTTMATRPYRVTLTHPAKNNDAWACYTNGDELVCAPFDEIDRRLHGADDVEEISL